MLRRLRRLRLRPRRQHGKQLPGRQWLRVRSLSRVGMRTAVIRTAPYDCSPCGSPNWGCNGYGIRSATWMATSAICRQRAMRPGANAVCHVAAADIAAAARAPGCQCCPFCGCGPSGDQNYNFNPGPPVAQTAYPYYTLRGPRDFLLGNPPSHWAVLRCQGGRRRVEGDSSHFHPSLLLKQFERRERIRALSAAIGARTRQGGWFC